MPLPRPIGDPFAPKDEDIPSSTPVKRPISSSAFSFHLGPKSTSTPARTKWEPMTTRVEGSSKEVKVEHAEWTPIRDRKVKPRAAATPLREMTPMKMKPLDSLPSFSLRTNTPGPIQDRKKMNDSPFAHPSTKRKLEERPMVSLMDTGVDLGEGIYIENVKRRVEEEGMGVSPRGKKIIKYHGKGPIPLSFILSNALNSQHSSLVLFYASLQTILYPTRTPKKGRMTPSALTEGSYPKAPTIQEHTKTAPVILKPVEVVKGRTGWSTMSYCQVVKGSLDQVVGKVVVTDKVERVMVVFQPVPSECAKLGLDPRILTLRPGGTYQIGLWGPWSTTNLSDSEGETTSEGKDAYNYNGKGEGTSNDGADGKGDGEETEEGIPVVFASRYLIAEL